MRCCRRVGCPLIDVSILARAEARALRNRAGQDFGSMAVSILARAEARALPRGGSGEMALRMFQSSRAPRRARCAGWLTPGSAHNGFNPRARRGARVALVGVAHFAVLFVSILARAEARALREIVDAGRSVVRFQSSRAPRRARCTGRRTHGRPYTRFNPRARRGARVARVRRAGKSVSCVSILARAEARALPRSSTP